MERLEGRGLGESVLRKWNMLNILEGSLWERERKPRDSTRREKRSGGQESKRERTSAMMRRPPGLRVRKASRRKSATLVPMRARQKTATSRQASGRGTHLMSAAVTNSFGATRSKKCN